MARKINWMPGEEKLIKKLKPAPTRPQGREKNVTGATGTVSKTGSGLGGTTPVGRKRKK